jgi:hypothetical protein
MNLGRSENIDDKDENENREKFSLETFNMDVPP